MTILVIDAGTSGIRALLVEDDGRVHAERYAETLPDSPAAGLVEFDAAEYASTAIRLACELLEERDATVDAVGISSQRASAVVWDRQTGRPVAPAQGWQDLRTIGDCLTLMAEGHPVAPNQTATKAADIRNNVDPDRSRDLCVGTPDSWLIWCLTEGRSHLTDASNAAVTGLSKAGRPLWDANVLTRLRIPEGSLPRIVDSVGHFGEATALPGAPPILGVAGDQQASLIGQGCVRPGLTKITFGTGGMLDACLGQEPPAAARRSAGGTFPIVCWQQDGVATWGLEAIMLSAGTNVQWLRDDLGLIGTSAESADVAAQCNTTEGVVYVPAQLGLGTPRWDYGARGALFGLTRGSTRAHVVRAVLEGVAQRGADLVDAAEADAGIRIESLRIDGGMSENPVFRQALADATQRVVEVAPLKEATGLGAAYLAGLRLGTWGSWDDIAESWEPAGRTEPGPPLDRAKWADAIERAARWYPELSSLDF